LKSKGEAQCLATFGTATIISPSCNTSLVSPIYVIAVDFTTSCLQNTVSN